MNAPANTTPDRTTFLGGSDAAAVMGLSPWATPVELWGQKTGRTPREPLTSAQQKRFDRGHRLEPFIRDMVIDKLRDSGVEVELIAFNERYVDLEHAFLACEIDFELRLTGDLQIGDRIVHLDKEHINGDAKSVTGFARKKWGAEDTEDVPIEYAAQFMHGLMVTGRRYCLVAALRSFDDVDIYWTVRDDETIAAMRPKLVQFWIEHVMTGVAPDPMVFSDIKYLFPKDDGSRIEATVQIAATVHEFARVKAQIKVLEEQADELQVQIADFISPHSVLTVDGREIASWKSQDTARIDQKSLKEKAPEIAAKFTTISSTRVLRLKKGSTK